MVISSTSAVLINTQATSPGSTCGIVEVSSRRAPPVRAARIALA